VSCTPRRNRRLEALTIVEVALFVCLIGVLLAVSVPAFLRSIRTSKMAEASHELSRIYAAGAAYYATPQVLVPVPAARQAASLGSARTGTALASARSKPLETPPVKQLHCMPVGAGPTPAKPSTAPVQVMFGAPESPESATWHSLGYEPSSAIRYRYSFLPAAPGCGVLGDDSHGEAVLTLRAEGDLDGDGVLSLFERKVGLSAGELALDPLLVVRDRVE
jgi:Tfp pilus assembly protein PilE